VKFYRWISSIVQDQSYSKHFAIPSVFKSCQLTSLEPIRPIRSPLSIYYHLSHIPILTMWQPSAPSSPNPLHPTFSSGAAHHGHHASIASIASNFTLDPQSPTSPQFPGSPTQASKPSYKLKNQGRRFAQIVKLKPEFVEKYKEVHQRVWPEVLKAIKEAGIEDCKLISFASHICKRI
jgi:hypothetical protein